MTPPADAPLVVGTIRPAGLEALADLPVERRAADVIEARFDLAIDPTTGGAPDLRPFFPPCRRLEATGSPVLGTIRLVADGGRWQGDGNRLPWFEEILTAAGCSWVDVEIESAIAAAVIAGAHARGRRVIVSHHDFARTRPAGELGAVVDRALGLGADIVKIATRVDGVEDHDRLLDLLRARRVQPLAVVGMGPVGTPLRSYLPAVGSRLTYGYLDETAAPGQLPAGDLVQRLLADCPAYAARRRARPAPPP